MQKTTKHSKKHIDLCIHTHDIHYMFYFSECQCFITAFTNEDIEDKNNSFDSSKHFRHKFLIE